MKVNLKQTLLGTALVAGLLNTAPVFASEQFDPRAMFHSAREAASFLPEFGRDDHYVPDPGFMYRTFLGDESSDHYGYMYDNQGSAKPAQNKTTRQDLQNMLINATLRNLKNVKDLDKATKEFRVEVEVALMRMCFKTHNK